MNGSPYKPRVLALLADIAPDVDPQSIQPNVDFRDQFDFDSMDLFSFAAALHDAFGIDIPERDYRQLMGVDKCTAYLESRLPHKGSAAG
jgi:acyl carrier protein